MALGGTGKEKQTNRSPAPGDRGAAGAKGLWERELVQEHYREQASFFTNDWDAYKQVMPAEKHSISARKKDSNHAKRFFCTLRQR